MKNKLESEDSAALPSPPPSWVRTDAQGNRRDEGEYICPADFASKKVALPSPNWKEELDYVPNEEGLNDLKAAINQVALPSSPAPQPKCNCGAGDDRDLRCHSNACRLAKYARGESVPSTPSPTPNLKDALRKYGRHLYGCNCLNEELPEEERGCDCGFGYYEVRL